VVSFNTLDTISRVGFILKTQRFEHWFCFRLLPEYGIETEEYYFARYCAVYSGRLHGVNIPDDSRVT
jgi:hypothetical protein